MNYTKFVVKNYKGIKDLTVDLNLLPDNKIYTLVGLNESGKTTILEAINDFEFEVPLDQRHLLIPKSSAGGFSGDVAIKTELSFSDDDKKQIKKFVLSKIKAKDIILQDKMSLERKYTFNNSTPGDSSRKYYHFISYKKTLRSKAVKLEDAVEAELWSFIKTSLFPEIIFYRDFLSKFPEKIYLQANDSKEKEYLSIIEDVLTSTNQSYKIETSLLGRLSSPTDANKQALEAVENEMSAKISKVVFDAWTKIQNVSKKEIVVKAEQEQGTNRYYVRLSVKDGHQTYAISERSLGFRWFFTFLLYTEFRKERIKTSGEILFLLDEPASNLHQTAQKSLLGTFKTITTKSRLIYTTHSHHLINPEWLNSTYIIKNKGIEYKENEDFNLTKTEIEAFQYKQFVSQYPTQTSYFQPILDVLDYQPGMLEIVPNIVITEGKFDYFIFRYFKEVIFGNNSNDFNFYPGHGASKLDLPIALYESWGRKYAVMLDSDKEGRDQKTRYISDLSNEEHVFTLEDAEPSLKNISIEKIFDENERIEISKEFNSALMKYGKSAFNTGIQMLFSQNKNPDYLTDQTKDKFQKILEFLKTKF